VYWRYETWRRYSQKWRVLQLHDNQAHLLFAQILSAAFLHILMWYSWWFLANFVRFLLKKSSTLRIPVYIITEICQDTMSHITAIYVSTFTLLKSVTSSNHNTNVSPCNVMIIIVLPSLEIMTLSSVGTGHVPLQLLLKFFRYRSGVTPSQRHCIKFLAANTVSGSVNLLLCDTQPTGES